MARLPSQGDEGSAGTAWVVPSANRGLKSPPSLESPIVEEPTLAIIDFLTFTAPFHRMVEGFGSHSAKFRAKAVEGDADAQYAVCDWLLDSIFPDAKVRLDPERKGFRNFYDNHFRIITPDGDQCGFIALGGLRQRGTICLELTGSGCAHVRAWAHVAAWLETFESKISRVDVAHDDFKGRHNLDDVLRWHEQGAFNSGGRPPAVQKLGWDDGSGKSVYIGKNHGNQQLCAYEKGRQQGARDGDAQANWVRFEGRFGSKYRRIPFDVLTDPAAYLVGHFPALAACVDVTPMRMKTSAERAAANLASSIRFAKLQCGAVFNVVRKHLADSTEFGEWMQRNVVRERLPAWLTKNPFGADYIHLAIT